MPSFAHTLTRLAVIGTLLTAGAAAVTSATTPASAVSVGAVSPALQGGQIGIDGAAYGNYCGGAYGGCVYWDANGNISPSLGGLAPGPNVRLEFYPYVTAGKYDPWTASAGGVHIWAKGSNIGNVSLPNASNGGVNPIGNVIAHNGVVGSRLKIDAFQYDNLTRTSGGQEEGAFASLSGKDGKYTLGYVWKAPFLVYLTDTLTGVQVFGFMDVGDSLPTIDLDAVCFGLSLCDYEKGSFGSVAGGFHPVSPTRILDTRVPMGITNGPLRQGDGRLLTEPSNIFRDDELVNHELQVTGTAGIPTSGASAVVLNVTVSQPSNDGFVSVFPSLPRGLRDPSDGLRLFDDQSSFKDGYPNVSNLNFRAGQDVPNLVVARIGAGGKIRFASSSNTTQIIADVVGWVDDGAQGGTGFVGITPTRLADTRFALGLGARLHSGDVRPLTVSPGGSKGEIPRGVSAVVLNVTSDGPTDVGFVTVYPSGAALPTASNLNTRPGEARANLVVAPVGPDGKVNFYLNANNTSGSADLIVDAVGYFTGSGGKVVAVDPTRVMDSRFGQGTPAGAFDAGSSRPVQISGNAGVPAGAKAVFINVTAVNPLSTGFLTVYPRGATMPNASNINYSVGNTVPNLVMVPLDAAGGITVTNSAATTDVLADVVAYVQ
ncbi:MAG: hypothetical protein QOD72_325 [Acidimicrobiaceae bacterium]|nr:hypothetical protein [Acidimicrobiaceae bacterium]